LARVGGNWTSPLKMVEELRHILSSATRKQELQTSEHPSLLHNPSLSEKDF